MNFKPIEFPKDEQAHDQIVEWWYFNGLVHDKNGNSYSFMNSLFRVDAKKAKIPFLSRMPAKILYFYHSIISDIGAEKFYPYIEFPTIVSADSFSKPLLFINHTSINLFEGYVNCGLEETEKFVYHLKDKNNDFKLTSMKKPLLVGGNGFLNFQTKSTYYYSLTNLKTAGLIKIKDKWLEVEGKSWMDHQWANASYSKDKWIWFSLQLENDTEIVCFEFEDQGRKNYLAGISFPDGHQEDFNDVIINPLEKNWISPKTKAVYPLVWNIKILAGKIDLRLEAMMEDQEMIFSSINYWEGPIKAGGSVDGKKVKGQGFMELVGFHSKYTSAKYVRDELAKTVGKIFQKR